MVCFLCTVALLAGTVLAAWFLASKIRKLSVYGFVKTLKWWLIWIHFRRQKNRAEKLFDYNSDLSYKDIRKLGLVATDKEWRCEQPRELLPDLNASDAVEFAGIDHHNRALVVRLARHQGRRARASIYLRLSEGAEYETTVHPDGLHCNVNPKEFDAGGLRIEVVEPFRQWRIVFRGSLRRVDRKTSKIASSTDNEDDLVDVSFNFLWSPAYHQYVQRNDYNLRMVVDKLANEAWNLDYLCSVNIDPEQRYDQWGQMRGQIAIGNNDASDVKYWAPKIRTYGILQSQISQHVNIHIHCEDGTVVSLRSSKNHGGLKNVTFGYVVLSSNFGIDTISECEFDVDTLCSSDSASDCLCIRFTAGGNSYVLSLRMNEQRGFRVFRDDDWKSESVFKMATGFLNDSKANGTVEIVRHHPFGECLAPRQTSLPLLEDSDLLTKDADDLLVVSLEDSACRCCHLVGGKSASLALMMSVKSLDSQFVVPRGLSLTKNSFHRHIIDNTNLWDAIARLEDVAWRRLAGILPDECQNTTNAIEESNLSTELKKDIRKTLQSVFGDEYNSLKFAVRSSAIGEDGAEMSAAGQNETVLGVIGEENIFKAITKCWASQFAHRSVEYKRFNGQVINGGMGVTIQLMVDSDISGVVFTSHPVSSNIGYVIITANYGLGESVVSGISEPDTIVLKNLDDGRRLIICDKDIGEKKIKIELGENGGVVERTSSPEEAGRLAMSDTDAISLGKVAVFLAKSYGGPRDIEYAIKDGQLFLLQCRPITTHLKETNYEMIHEFDTPLITENERFTIANVGEVFPGATSPLYLSSPFRMVQASIQISNFDKMERPCFNPILFQGVILYCNHLIVDKISQKLFGLSKEVSPMSLGVELGIHGRIINDHELHALALKRFKIPGAGIKLKSLYNVLFKCIILGKRYLDSAKARYENFNVPTEGVNRAEDLLNIIETYLFEAAEMLTIHVRLSTSSILWNVTVLGMLKGSSKDYELDQYHDFATLVGNSNGVLSGDVPASLRDLAEAIEKEIGSTQFINMDPGSAFMWLQTEAKAAGDMFREFLVRHGHRCYKEYDVSSISWGMQPDKLIHVLQNMLSVPIQPRSSVQEQSIKEILQNVKSTLTPKTKRILSYILPICRRAICNREQSKSLLVKIHHEIRLAFRQLGHMMVNEELIPDPELIFYMTSAELTSLFKSRSSRIISRATQRRKLFPTLENLHFPEFMTGDPKAFEEEEDNSDVVTTGGKRLSAYPVCQGVAKGPARVITSFDQVDQINPGDILITQNTDIGWSPYFPMLAGVVTEIGGLVSHGAVVAREYGLPCIVAARGATKMFKSGEIVLLNADKGTLELVEETE